MQYGRLDVDKQNQASLSSAHLELVIAGIRRFLELTMAPTYAARLIGYILLCTGMPPKEITQLLSVTDRTCRNWRKQLRAVEQAGEIGLLLVRPIVDIGTKAWNITTEILKAINAANYHTLRQIADMIQERFGLKLSESTVGRMLHREGYTKRKAGSLPAKADPAKQRAFYEETMRPLMEAAKAGKTALFFMDASHFVLGCDFLGSVWCKVRRFVQTFSGRKRYNVLGALEYGTASMLTVTNDDYITAPTVCDIIEKIASFRDEHFLASVSVILDNARYQRCSLVQNLAAKLNVKLVFLPPYSPNLNLIERLWKLVKSELRTKYYDDFVKFKLRIDSILGDLSGTYRKQVSNLLHPPHILDNLKRITTDTYEISEETGKTA